MQQLIRRGWWAVLLLPLLAALVQAEHVARPLHVRHQPAQRRSRRRVEAGEAHDLGVVRQRSSGRTGRNRGLDVGGGAVGAPLLPGVELVGLVLQPARLLPNLP